jgi:hypothetical protein
MVVAAFILLSLGCIYGYLNVRNWQGGPAKASASRKAMERKFRAQLGVGGVFLIMYLSFLVNFVYTWLTW